VPVAIIAALAAFLYAAPAGASTNKADMARAKAALLRTGDVPTGFTRKPGKTNDDNDTFGAGNPDCKKYSAIQKVANKARTGKAGVEFHGTDPEEIDEDTGLTKTAAPVKALVAAFNSDATGRCLDTELKKSIEQEVDDPSVPIDVQVARSRLPKLGDQRAGWDINVSFTVGGSEQHLLISFVAVRAGRGAALLSFQTQGALVDQRDAVLRTAAKRLQAAVS